MDQFIFQLSSLIRDESRNCWERGSFLYGTLLEFTADDVEAKGSCWSVLAGHAQDAIDSALALRFLRSIHLLVLSGLAPELAIYYPSVGGSAQREGLQSAFLSVVKNNCEYLCQKVKGLMRLADVLLYCVAFFTFKA
jgi:hypothetical protein